MAKVPILRFDDVHNNLEVDLNYNNCVGIRNSHLLYCYTQCKLKRNQHSFSILSTCFFLHFDNDNFDDFSGLATTTIGCNC